MQEGMRIKSIDIHFVQSIFYLANKIFFDLSFLFLFYSIDKGKYKNLVYLLAYKIERACMYPTGKLMTN